MGSLVFGEFWVLKGQHEHKMGSKMRILRLMYCHSIKSWGSINCRSNGKKLFKVFWARSKKTIRYTSKDN